MENSTSLIPTPGGTPIDTNHDPDAPASVPTAAEIGDATALASVRTFAETVDIKRATKAATKVAPGQTKALAGAVKASGKSLKDSKTQEQSSHNSLHEGLAKILSAGQMAYEHPEVLIALAAKEAVKKKITITAASWRAPFLVLIKLARPDIDDKTASCWGRALNYIAALGLSGEDAEGMLKTHGVTALAAAEAKRKKARKEGKPATPPEDPMEVLRRRGTAVPLPASFELEDLPVEDQVAVMIIGRHEGQLVAWAVDADEKGTAAAIRRVLKRIKEDSVPD